MGFSRQEYWSGLPCPPPGDLPKPGIEPRSPTLQVILYHLRHQGRPWTLEWVAYSFSRGSSWLRNWTGVTLIAGGLHQLSYQGSPMIISAAAAAAAKLLQSCPTLCDPIDGSPRGFCAPGILPAITLEWAAISFRNAWKWKVKVKSLSRVWLFATPWSAAHQASPSMGFSRREHWSGVPLPSPMIISAAAAAKSLQSCPTLRDPIDGSPPRFRVPEILQTR